jgi:hypothetical protein
MLMDQLIQKRSCCARGMDIDEMFGNYHCECAVSFSIRSEAVIFPDYLILTTIKDNPA